MDAPKPTGNTAEVSLTECYLAYNGTQPALLSIDGSDAEYLPVFTTLAKLYSSMKSVPYTDAKLIQDGNEFLSSIPDNIVVILDLHRTQEGKTKWLEIKRDLGSHHTP